MPELPDVELYCACLVPRVVGQRLARLRLASPFVLRSVEPPPDVFPGRTVRAVRRLAKRVVLAFDDDLFAVVHLMIAGRFRWGPPGARVPGKLGLAAFDFPTGTLLLTEASPKQRASLHLVRGEDALRALDPGGIEVLDADLDAFRAALVAGNNTLKRALTDPRRFAGIGNAYSDEILHRARLSPVALTQRLDAAEVARLHAAARAVLREWTARLRAGMGARFPGPGDVTAFRPDMVVHGRFRQPCPVCGAPVQRIVHAENECNYCPGCQTGGAVLADRSLSRLLKADWPRSLDDLERAPAGAALATPATPRTTAARKPARRRR